MKLIDNINLYLLCSEDLLPFAAAVALNIHMVVTYEIYVEERRLGDE